VNGVIADVLRSFVSERQDDWPSLIPLVEFAINDSASPLGMGYTPFFADRHGVASTPAVRSQHQPTRPSLRRRMALRWRGSWTT